MRCPTTEDMTSRELVILLGLALAACGHLLVHELLGVANAWVRTDDCFRRHGARLAGLSLTPAAVARQPRLQGVRTGLVSTPGSPFGVVAAPNGGWSFMATMGRGIDVLSDRRFLPRVVHTVTLRGDAAVGETITRDGRYVLAADDGGPVVLDAERDEQGRDDAVLGRLRAPSGGAGAIEVATSADGRFAFVTLEGAGRMAVFNLGAALAGHFRASEFVGDVPLGEAPVGMALVDHDTRIVVADSNRFAAAGARAELTVVNAAAALAGRPAVAGSLPAGRFPREEAVEPGGRTLLVGNVAPGQLEAVDTARLP
jgi:hypothetical protein